jgi:hypothetical protein
LNGVGLIDARFVESRMRRRRRRRRRSLKRERWAEEGW